MDDRQFLEEVREYIENMETRMDAEYGAGYDATFLIARGMMPDLYNEVLRRVEMLPAQPKDQHDHHPAEARRDEAPTQDHGGEVSRHGP